MSHGPTENLPAGADTPVDERPPYDEPGRRWPLFVAAVVLGVGCSVVLGAVALAVLALVAGVGVVARLASRRRDRGKGVIFMNGYDVPYAGPVYEVRFYDGQFPQLTDLDLSIALPSMYGPAADAALAALAEECRRAVEARDSQRCFRPRVVVVDGHGRTLRAWQVTR